jgi:hypothetical protein
LSEANPSLAGAIGSGREKRGKQSKSTSACNREEEDEQRHLEQEKTPVGGGRQVVQSVKQLERIGQTCGQEEPDTARREGGKAPGDSHRQDELDLGRLSSRRSEQARQGSQAA